MRVPKNHWNQSLRSYKINTRLRKIASSCVSLYYITLTSGAESPVTLGSWRSFQVTIWNLIPFLSSQCYLDYPLSVKGKTLLIDEITKLLNKGAIRKVSSCPYEFISNIFLVPKKTGVLLPVINLKPLNQFVQRIHFKMENIQMAMNFVSLGDYMVSLDLKDAYFSVPILRPHCKYLRFIWRDQIYEFTCLPFGYSLAPRVFAKIFKPIVAQLKLNGLGIVIFLDDILLLQALFAECMEQLSLLRKLLESLGFVINDAKSQ